MTRKRRNKWPYARPAHDAAERYYLSYNPTLGVAQHLRRDGILALGTTFAIALTWFFGWVALESVSVATAFAVTATSFWILRKDRDADQLRLLVPWVAARIVPYDPWTADHLTVEVSAFGNGDAWNVSVSLHDGDYRGTHDEYRGDSDIKDLHLRAGERKELSLPRVPPKDSNDQFDGLLFVRYGDVTGQDHWSIYYAYGDNNHVRTIGAPRWECPRGCIVHPGGGRQLWR